MIARVVTASMGAALLPFVAVLATAQAPDEAPSVEAEFPQGFTSVIGVRQLLDGRLLIADDRENRIELLDLRSGATRAVSRQGAGPNEFQSVFAILPRPGDTTWVIDPLGGRALVVAPDGTVSGTRSLTSLGGVFPTAADQAAGLYGAPPRSFTERAIVRFDELSVPPDTVAVITTIGGTGSVRNASGTTITLRSTAPFQVFDEWAVSWDGTVVIARALPYHIERISPDGTRTVGPALSYDPVRIPSDERAEAIERFQLLRSRLPPEVNLPDPTVPENRPPFTGKILLGPVGEVWVPLTPVTSEDPVIYDVIGPDGRRLKQVRMPAATKLIAIGPSALYSIRTDALGLQYIQRRSP